MGKPRSWILLEYFGPATTAVTTGNPKTVVIAYGVISGLSPLMEIRTKNYARRSFAFSDEDKSGINGWIF